MLAWAIGTVRGTVAIALLRKSRGDSLPFADAMGLGTILSVAIWA